jgi:hypothetical protein
MLAYRQINDTGTIYTCEFDVEPGGFVIHKMCLFYEAECRAERREIPAGAPMFWQIEMDRPSGRLVVALVIGAGNEFGEPDWSNSVTAAVLNPKRADEYGGLSNLYRRLNRLERKARRSPRKEPVERSIESDTTPSETTTGRTPEQKLERKIRRYARTHGVSKEEARKRLVTNG